MIYAPVIVKTLNRYEHLRRCIESLQRNEWSEYTELYISVDYPVKQSHWEGYLKIKEYVNSEISGFKSVTVFMQDRNLGSYKNADFIIDKVFEKYDRAIETEDDNEFSHNFIEYMDRGLERFKGDSSILFISGYVDEQPWNSHGGNIMKLATTSYYGLGIWKDKWLQLRTELKRELFDKIGRNPYYVWKLYHYSRNMLWWYVHRYLCDPYEPMFDEHGELALMDINFNIYCIIENKYIIVPIQSLVRNWGRDGSGEHCGINVEYHPENFVISEDKNFVYKIPESFRMEEDNRIIQAGIDGSLKFKDNIKVLQNWLLFKFLGEKGYHRFIETQKEFRSNKRRSE